MITRNVLPVALGLLSTLAAPVAAQGPLPRAHFLPTHRVAEVGQALTAFQLERAIRSALNSEGDKLALELTTSASAALIALVNAGGATRFQVEVSRVRGGYEASILHDVAQTCGVEVYEGLEVNARTGIERKVVLFWPDTAATARGLESLALGYGLRLADTIPLAWSRYLDHRFLVEQAQQLYSNALSSLAAAQRLESTRRTARSDAHAAIATAQRAVDSAYATYRDAVAAVRAAQRAIDDSPLPNFLKGALRRALQAAVDTMNRAADGYRRAIAGLNDARAAYDRADSLWRSAVDAIASHEAAVRQSVDRLRTRRSESSQSYSVWEGLDGLREILATHVRAAQFKVYRGTDLSGVLTVPGVSLENLGLGFQLSNRMGAQVRIDQPFSRDSKQITVSGVAELQMGAFAGVGVGVNGRTKAELGVNVVFRQAGSLPQFRNGRLHGWSSLFAFDRVDVGIELDLEARAQAGIGWTAAHGVGRKVKIVATHNDWHRMQAMARDLVTDPSVDALGRALAGLTATVTLHDHWIAGGVANFGGSLLGYGFGVGGSALWYDQGDTQTWTLNAREVFGAIADVREARGALERLAAARR